MKKFMTFVILMTIVSLFCVLPGYAQGKGGGAIPSSSQGHGQIGSQSHGQSSTLHQSESASEQQSKRTWETQFSDRLASDPAFKTRIMSLLPPNTDPVAAAGGFKNHGQFIAALHVSKNLGISFDLLKAKMTGASTNASGQTVTSNPISLGKAIHELQPTIPVNQANEEASKAEKQAKLTEKTTPTT
jgi:hypothetical protein